MTRLPIVILALILSSIAPSARATTVAPMDVRLMADLAGEVFTARITHVESYWLKDPRRIESRITFEEFEPLKGDRANAGKPLTLIVPGGRVGDHEFRIAGAPSFEVGEKWLLFVLPTYNVYPTVGIFRGAFEIRVDQAGIERVFTSEGQPVKGITDAGEILADSCTCNAPHQPPPAPLEQHGVRIVESNGAHTAHTTPLPLSDFVSHLRPILNASRAHELTGRAGAPLRPAWKAVPLRKSAHELTKNPSDESSASAPPEADVAPSDQEGTP